MDVICIGEMLIDFTPGKEENSYVRNPGGAPANVAIGMKRNGLDVGFLGKLGNDDFGVFLKNTLSENKVKILCPELTNEAVTTMAFVTLYKDGERSFTFVRNPGADILLTKEDIKERDIDNCRLCHAGSVSLSQSPSREAVFYGMELAHLKEKLVSFDINYRNMIWSEEDCKKEVDKVLPFVDFLKISEEELYFVGGEEHIVETMEKFHISLIIETLGSKGAKYFFRGKNNIIEGKKVRPIDATGAGDAFWGGFLSKLLLNGVNKVEDLTENIVIKSIEYGNTAGAICVQKMGGIPALPYREEIEKEI